MGFFCAGLLLPGQERTWPPVDSDSVVCNLHMNNWIFVEAVYFFWPASSRLFFSKVLFLQGFNTEILMDGNIFF